MAISKLYQRIGFVSAIVAALVVLAFGVAHLPFVRARVLDAAREYAARELGLRIAAGGLDYNLLGPSVELRDVTLASADGSARPFLQAAAVRVTLSRSLFRGEIDLTHLELVGAHLAIVRHADRTLNLPQSHAPTDTQATPLRLGRIDLRDLRLGVDDEASGSSWSLGPVSLSIDTSGGGAPPGAFGPSPFTLRLGANEPPDRTAAGAAAAPRFALAGTLAGRLAFDGTRLAVPELTIATPEGRLTLEGAIEAISQAPRLDLRAQLQLDLAAAAHLAGLDEERLSGTMGALVTTNGPISAPAITARITGQRLSVRSVQNIGLSATASLADGRVDLTALDLRSPLGVLHGRGELAVAGAAGRLSMRWTDLDLDGLLDAVQVATPARLGARTSGHAELALTAAGPTRPSWLSRLDADATTAFHPGDAGLALDGAVDLRVRQGAWTLRHRFTSSAADASFAGTLRGALDPHASGSSISSIAGTASLRAADLGTVVPLLRDAGIRLPQRLTDGLGGSLDADVNLSGTSARPTLRARVAARDLRAAGLTAGAIDAEATVTRDALLVRSLAVRLGGGTRLNASGSYAWSGRTDVQFDAEAADLADLARALATSARQASGSARLTGRTAGTVDSPRVEARLDARDIAIDGSAIGAVQATIALADRRLHVEAQAPALALVARADLDTVEPYGFDAQARFDRTRLPALVPLSLRDRIPVSDGTLAGTIRARGTLQEPSALSAESSLDRFDAVIAGTPVALETPATIAWTPGRLAVSGLALRLAPGTLASVSGSLADVPANDPLRIRIDGSLTDLVALAGPHLPASAALRAEGTLAAELSVGGTLRAPAPSGTIALRATHAAYGELPPAHDLVLDARVEPSQLVLQSFSVRWQQASASAEGALPFRVAGAPFLEATPQGEPPGAAPEWLSHWFASLPAEPTAAALSARVTGLTPEVLRPFISAERLRDLSGTIALSLTARADALSLERTQALVVLDDASFTAAGVPFTQRAPTRVRIDHGRASIDDLRWDSLGNPLTVAGTADLRTGSVDLKVDGTIDLRVLGVVSSGVGTAGTARAAVTICGPPASPEITGEIVVADGELRLDSPRVVASELEGSVRIAPDRTAVVALSGTVNGGSATLAGTMSLARPDDPRGELTLTARDVAVEYPDGLQTESSAKLTLRLGAAAPTLSGRIDVHGGTYREPIVVSSRLLEGLQQRGIATAARPPDFLSSMGLDVTLAAAEGIRIENNYGRLEVAGTVRASGTLARPGLVGRFEAAPDGEVFLAGQTYQVERLVVDFSDPAAIAPDLSFLARTRVGEIPMDVELLCPASGACERHVRSLAVGTTDEEADARLFGLPADASAAGEQLARLLSGDVLGLVSRQVGLDTLRLEQGTRGRADIFDDPTLVAGDVDPASRLTVGKRLGDRVELAYSQNLTGSGFTQSTTYYAPYGLSARALLLDDQSRSYELRHEPRFGGTRRARIQRPPAPRVVEVRIGGNPGLPERDVRRQLRLGPGDRFNHPAWQRDRDRLEALYRSQGFHEARIRARRVPVATTGATPAGTGTPSDAASNGVVLEYAIERGPLTRLEVRGATLPEEVLARILDRWPTALIDAFLERDATAIVRDHLYREGYVRAVIDVSLVSDDASGAKTLAIRIDPGPVVPRRLEFTGNAGIPAARLYRAASAAGSLTAWIDPASFARTIESFYRDEGFLSARVNVLPPDERGATSVVSAVVDEGPSFTVGELGLESGGVLPERELRDTLGVRSGGPYQPRAIGEGLDRVDARLRRAGYLSSRTTADTSVHPQAARVDVHVVVRPGPQSVLRSVLVEGADPQKPIVARAITLAPGAPIDTSALVETRRRLYESGAYRGVEIELVPADASETATAGTGAETQPMDARIRLLERPRYRFRYGIAFQDDVVAPDVRDRRFGLAADFERRNLFGPGGVAGVSARFRRDQQVGRLFLGANRFFGAPLRSTLFLERSREEINTEGAFPIVAAVTDLSAEQTYGLRRRVELRYGYAFGRNRTFIEDQDFDLTVRVARLTSSGIVDRRADPFDPDRGWFAASNVELSRPSLGSDLSFLKGFMQYFHFKPAGRGMVLAAAARVGLARTFEGQDLIPSERFFAGGATSVRGYREEDLGPRSIFGDAEGGRALVVLNGELRFPVYRWIRGVGFVDLGNVYPAVGAISLGDLQIAIGAGIRLDTPVGLLRMDFGIPTNPRSFDPAWRLHFGLGHAF